VPKPEKSHHSHPPVPSIAIEVVATTSDQTVAELS